MQDPANVIDHLRRAEPEFASGTYVEHLNGVAVAATVFAYRRGGAWALLSSTQGLRVTDAHFLWSASRGDWTLDEQSPPGYHSGSLRDMLVPRHRDFVRDGRHVRIAPTIGPSEILGRSTWTADVLGEPRFHEWQLHIDAESGVVLQDRVVDSLGEVFTRGFLALDLGSPLPDDLFTWSPRDRE